MIKDGKWVTKLVVLQAHMAAGEWHAAIRLAAKFPQLGEAKVPITRAWEALRNPDFYTSIGRDPGVLVAAGIDALQRRYGKEKVKR